MNKSYLSRLKRSLPLLVLTSVCMVVFSSHTPPKHSDGPKKGKPNILFIPVDDLRPETGCYGNRLIRTPNIDRLAAEGVVFNRAYCQQALCNPSRASLLTGLTPDALGVWDLQTDFRVNRPEVVTLPQFFKNNGYQVIGYGKTFHNIFPDSVSWTELPHLLGYPFDPDAVYANTENIIIQKEKELALLRSGKAVVDQHGFYYTKANSVESADVPDDFYFDGAQTTVAIKTLESLKESEQPFFLSVGYYRPHLPFNAPRKYWDLYDREKLPLAPNQFVPHGAPAFSMFGDYEMRSYTDNHELPVPTDRPWDEKRQRELIHGYYASVSYVDAQIGRLLQALDSLGLKENTIIVLWGDHGWKLGEHNGWGKMTNYEIDTHAPLIMSGYGVKNKGRKSNSLVEFLDIYPTLCEVAGYEVPSSLYGKSLTSMLRDQGEEPERVAYSQYMMVRSKPHVMGYTVRTDRYRYVEWYAWDRAKKEKGAFVAAELYNHVNDAEENLNIVEHPENRQAIKELKMHLKKRFAL